MAMPGWRLQRDRLTFTAFVGLDYQDHRLSPDDMSAGLRGRYLGLRTGFDLWYQFSADTMIAADASVSSIGPGYSVRIAMGWRAFDRFYVGPEIGGFAVGDNYQQARAGIHLTGFKTENFEWSAALGWAKDSDSRGSPYGRIGMLARH
jgi:hypothetical protein